MRRGKQITSFTQQNRRFDYKPSAEWFLHTAQSLGLHGAMIMPASEGFGRHQRIHFAHFFELADQPQQVVMAVTADEAARLFVHLEALKVQIFHIKTPAEFGISGNEAAAAARRICSQGSRLRLLT
jgi:PII-like signaling protein